jgi:hypothetical protein
MTTKALIDLAKTKGFNPLFDIPPRKILPERLELILLEDLKSWLRETLNVFVHVEPLNGWDEWTVTAFAKTKEEPFSRFYVDEKRNGVEKYLYALRIGLTQSVQKLKTPEQDSASAIPKTASLFELLSALDIDINNSPSNG